ncbi:FMP21-like protein [Cordyceps militaris CM01]|uniref:Succinate dehydrogenase assembly factor 4, mitochondrial n=1 Tax=Cordyceps militaris (strain CM01) TaxID=983644 RepID=G3JRT8_CORMM|nr:FMP21-like protein [Cordyceps militaris CM01]EGX88531.1 FMP21-like protein [Cordyceps militaris CM01]
MLTRLPPAALLLLRASSSSSPRLALATFAARRHASSTNFGTAPAPPKLPAKEQAEFERLQRAAAVSSAFQPDAAPPAETSRSVAAADAELDTRGGLYRGARPEFDGDRNPRTGEVGGPKNEPLRWGSAGDWSYNGKVTDF